MTVEGTRAALLDARNGTEDEHAALVADFEAAVRDEADEFHHRLPGQTVCNICAECEQRLERLLLAIDREVLTGGITLEALERLRE